MDSQSSLAWDPSTMHMVRFANFMLPHEQYSTSIVNFPGTHCIPHFQDHGDFYHNFLVYQNGKMVCEIAGAHVTDKQVMEMYFDEMLSAAGEDAGAIVITEFHHTKTIPVEMYVNHVHRKTGTYLSYPASMFVGDLLYPEVHATQLENTLFWAGIPETSKTEFGLIVVNPYKLSYSYQVTLFRPNGERVNTEVMKIPRYTYRHHALTELFPEYIDEIRAENGRSAICIGAQYKLVAFVALRNRDTNVISTVDHLHSYCLV